MMRRFLLTGLLIPTLAIGLLGCGGDTNTREFTDNDDVENTDPDHGHSHDDPPHGGHYIVLGDEEYHAEVVFNEETRALGVYLLGPDAQTATPIKASEITFRLGEGDEPTELKLAAVPQGDPEGTSSYFEVAGDVIPEEVHDIEEVHGEVVVDIEGTPYSGKLAHDHGDDHGHAHD